MKIAIHKKSPFSLRDQIKRQIRALIDRGDLEPGQALPSARDLSALLNVNRHTITQAYKELTSEGILKIMIGSGTFVKDDLSLKSKEVLDRMFTEVIEKAEQRGFTREEITEHFLNRLSALTAASQEKRVVVVDCNDEMVNYIRNKIFEDFALQAEGYWIQKIEKNPKAALAHFQEKDLVVCGMNHFEEIKSALPELKVDVIGVLLNVEAKIINTIAQLPPGAKVGFVCANQRSTETLYNSASFEGSKKLNRILVGLDNAEKLQKLFKECEIIFVTHFVHDRMQKLFGSHPGLNIVNL